MTREIKFRAWDIQLNTMVYASNDVIFYPQRLDKKIIMQFTGLLDKNGKEVFEGDIYDIYESKEVASTNAGQLLYPNCEVVFNVGCFCFMIPAEGAHPRVALPMYFESNRRWEFKGNIYENPNLINNQS